MPIWPRCCDGMPTGTSPQPAVEDFLATARQPATDQVRADVRGRDELHHVSEVFIDTNVLGHAGSALAARCESLDDPVRTAWL